MLKAVLFDLDGTLLDTAADFTRVLNGLLAEHQRPLQDYNSVRCCVSEGARAVVRLGFGLEPEDPAFAPLLNAFLDRYEASLSEETSLFPGMEGQLQKLESRGIAWGIVTNKPARFTTPLLKQLALTSRCATAVCPDDVSNRKPHPEPMYLACKHIGIRPSEAIYVGDHRRDIDAGRNAGMKTIACRYGYVPLGEDIGDWKADIIIDHAQQLDDALQQLQA
jgi:phosphoglycolate phosphatase